MENQRTELMKYFALSLKRRAKDEADFVTIHPGLLRYFGRKELIEVIHYKSNGNSPQADELMEMENEELLQLIEDELYILAYITKQWCKELEEKKSLKLNEVSSAETKEEIKTEKEAGKTETKKPSASASQSSKNKTSTTKPQADGK